MGSDNFVLAGGERKATITETDRAIKQVTEAAKIISFYTESLGKFAVNFGADALMGEMKRTFARLKNNT